MPEDMSDRVPEDMPDRMPEDLPDRMPEDMPDHMPEDMPDRMPNRMSEDMSDRMPEDLPVRKCINVMVGITRSKVIIFIFIFFKKMVYMGLPWFTPPNMFWLPELGDHGHSLPSKSSTAKASIPLEARCLDV